MNWLSKIFGGGSRPEPVEQPPCQHTQLAPSWDNAEDLGNNDKITGYKCTACGQSFTVDEAKRLEAGADRPA